MISLEPKGQYVIFLSTKEQAIHWIKNFNLRSPLKHPHPQFPVTTSLSSAYLELKPT